MKITNAAPAFQPINLVIESEAEVKLLANLIACCSGRTSEVACGSNEVSYDLWRVLQPYADRDIAQRLEITTK